MINLVIAIIIAMTEERDGLVILFEKPISSLFNRIMLTSIPQKILNLLQGTHYGKEFT